MLLHHHITMQVPLFAISNCEPLPEWCRKSGIETCKPVTWSPSSFFTFVASDAVMPELNANVVQHVSEVPKHQSSCAHGSELNVQRSAHLRRASNSRGPRLMEFERACSSWSGRDCE